MATSLHKNPFPWYHEIKNDGPGKRLKTKYIFTIRKYGHALGQIPLPWSL